MPDSPNNNNPDGVGSSDQIFEFNPSEIVDKKLVEDKETRRSLHAPQYESSSEENNIDDLKNSEKGARSKSSKPLTFQ
jgi:hypothetical protein